MQREENKIIHIDLETENRHNPSGHRSTNVSSHNYRNSLPQSQQSRIYETNCHYRCRSRRLYRSCHKCTS